MDKPNSNIDLIYKYANAVERVYELLGGVKTKLEYVERHLDRDKESDRELYNEIITLQRDINELLNIHKKIDSEALLKNTSKIIDDLEFLINKVKEISGAIASKDVAKEIHAEIIQKVKTEVIATVREALSEDQSFDQDVIKAIYHTIKNEEDANRQKNKRWWLTRWFYFFGLVVPVVITSFANILSAYLNKPEEKSVYKEEMQVIKEYFDAVVSDLNMQIKKMKEINNKKHSGE